MNEKYNSLLYFILLIPAIFLKTWVIVVMWGWFVIPTFNLPSINMPTALGLLLLITYIASNNRKNKYNKGWVAQLISDIYVTPLIVLGLSWLVLQFM